MTEKDQIAALIQALDMANERIKSLASELYSLRQNSMAHKSPNHNPIQRNRTYPPDLMAGAGDFCGQLNTP